MGWFKEWFGTHYYKLLYSHRSEEEAQLFLDRLLEKLQIVPGSKIVDVGCGQGRHSIYLAQKGFEVTGFDVSEENIRNATENAPPNATFFWHDMRMSFPVNDFDVALNLFTSFGYFESEAENQLTINNIYKALAKNALLVIDFFNAEKVKQELVEEEQITIENIDFKIKRSVEKNFVVKKIQVTDGGEVHFFQERVCLLHLNDFKKYFERTGFTLQNTFGNYLLDAYDENSSSRLIMIASKSA